MEGYLSKIDQLDSMEMEIVVIPAINSLVKLELIKNLGEKVKFVVNNSISKLQ